MVILALVVHVVIQNIPKLDELALGHTMHVEKIKVTEHTSALPATCDSATEMSMNVPVEGAR